MAAGGDLVNRHDYEEIQNGSDNQEIDDRINERTPVKGHTVDDESPTMHASATDEFDDWFNE